MKKEEFLKQLEQLLSGISEEERADALSYYRSYFEDAGEENEEAIIAELESPQKVADSIRKNLGIEGNGSYYNSNANRDAEYYRNVNNTIQNMQGQAKAKNGGNYSALTITLLIITSPIWLTALIVFASIILALLCALLGIAIGVVAVMGALVIAGVVVTVIGFQSCITIAPPVGIALIGCGLLILALGLLAVLFVVWIFGGFLPWAWKGIVKLCKMPFEKRRERKALQNGD